MIFFEVDRKLKVTVKRSLITRAIQATLQHLSVPEDSNLTIVLADDAQLQTLNRDYLGIDAPTDVLSFPAHEPDPESGNIYLGDIIISLPQAKVQAQTAGHPLGTEIQLLVVHGMLHLMGYDHSELDEKARMWAAQSEILNKLGVGDIRVNEA
jgi:probable rRNA maturation factor